VTIKLHDLKPKEGSKKERKRVGRGIAAGQGKTAGRGTKGQGARSGGGVRLYHQGGNLPFYRRLPFMRGKGFNALKRVEFAEINLNRLDVFPEGSEVSPETMVAAGLLRDANQPVVILGDGDIRKALKLRVHRISKNARQKVEAAGGSVEIIPFE
jgi:large subunit ribosomal protein L15